MLIDVMGSNTTTSSSLARSLVHLCLLETTCNNEKGDQQMFYHRYIAKPIYLHDLQFRMPRL